MTWQVASVPALTPSKPGSEDSVVALYEKHYILSKLRRAKASQSVWFYDKHAPLTWISMQSTGGSTPLPVEGTRASVLSQSWDTPTVRPW